jgi:hypothetical protein
MATSLGATRVIVLPTGFARALTQLPSGAIVRAMHALSLLVARQLVRDAERFAGGAVELRIVPSVCPRDTSPYDYTAAATLIAQAKAKPGARSSKVVLIAQAHRRNGMNTVIDRGPVQHAATAAGAFNAAFGVAIGRMSGQTSIYTRAPVA